MKPQPVTQENVGEVALYAALTAHLLLCLLDRLQNSSANKQAIKAKINALLPELARWVDSDMKNVWGQSNKMDMIQYEVQNGLNEIIYRLSHTKVHLLPAIAGLLREFEQCIDKGATEMLINFNKPNK